MNLSTLRAASFVAACALFNAHPAKALSIREYRKLEPEKQAVYVGAAVSMAANMYAAHGDTAKASCIMDWFFRGKQGQEPTGPHDLALEIGIAERQDPSKYQIEGIVLGVVEKSCPDRKR